jgi:hypothetical protein
MSRIGYSEDEDYPGQHALWQANVRRCLNGRAGKEGLRELEAALLALPSKRLISQKLIEQGEVCAIGAIALHKGATEEHLETLDEEYMEGVGEEYGLPRLVAWAIVEKNDYDLESYSVTAPGPNQYGFYHGYQPGYRLRVEVTPEERYKHMLAWVQRQLAAA